MKHLLVIATLLASSCATGPATTAATIHRTAETACVKALEVLVAKGQACEDKPCALRAQVAFKATDAACVISLKKLVAKVEAEAAKAEVN